VNKQEAEDFILQGLADNISRDEIVEELSHLLNAPQDLVEKFVIQVEFEHFQDIEHSLIEDMDSQNMASRYGGRNTSTQTAGNYQTTGGINLKHEPTSTVEVNKSSQEFQPQYIIPQPRGEEITNGTSLENPELTKYVINELKKGRKRNDIVMAICEQSNVEWIQAQRFVANIEVEYHSHIKKKKSWPILVLSIIAVIGGIVIIIVSLAAILPVLNIISFTEYDPNINIPIPVDFALAALITGFGIVLGGIVGIYQSIQSRIE
jgi:hypothetical protein